MWNTRPKTTNTAAHRWCARHIVTNVSPHVWRVWRTTNTTQTNKHTNKKKTTRWQSARYRPLARSNYTVHKYIYTSWAHAGSAKQTRHTPHHKTADILCGVYTSARARLSDFWSSSWPSQTLRAPRLPRPHASRCITSQLWSRAHMCSRHCHNMCARHATLG